jgi:hypothetical protein
MDFNIESTLSNKYLKNKYDFLDIEKHLNYYEIELYYIEKNLLYIKIWNKKNNSWDEDIKLRIYTINNDSYEDISIGGSIYYEKEMELYLDIDLEYNQQIIRKYIPNNVLLNKNINLNNKIKYYDNKKFIHINNYYIINNDLSIINNFIINNYQEINKLTEYILNDNIKLLIHVLLYLNKNGGIYINYFVKNIKLDDYNIDDNLCFINNDLISLIYSKINFLNKDLLFEDLKNKTKIIFNKYLNNFTIKYDKPIIEDKIQKIENNYYSDIFLFNNYNFYILSKNNIKYNIEELQGGYYCLTTSNENEIEYNIIIEIYDNNKNTKFILNDNYIKNKFKNNYIIKI